MRVLVVLAYRHGDTAVTDLGFVPRNADTFLLCPPTETLRHWVNYHGITTSDKADMNAYDVLLYLGDHVDLQFCRRVAKPLVMHLSPRLRSIANLNLTGGSVEDLLGMVRRGKVVPVTSSAAHRSGLLMPELVPKIVWPCVSLTLGNRSASRHALNVGTDLLLYAHVDSYDVQQSLEKRVKRESPLPNDDHHVGLLIHTLARVRMFRKDIRLVLSSPHPDFSKHIKGVVARLKHNKCVDPVHWKQCVADGALILTHPATDAPLDLLAACDLFVHPHLSPDIGGLPLVAMASGVPAILPMGTAFDELHVLMGDRYLFERVPCLPLSHKHNGEQYMVISPLQMAETILKCAHKLPGIKQKVVNSASHLAEVLACPNQQLGPYLEYIADTANHPSYPALSGA